MATNIMELPVFSVMAEIGSNEDWLDGFEFVDETDAAIDIRGIDFTMMVRQTVEDEEVTLVASTANGYLKILGTGFNTLMLDVPYLQVNKMVIGFNVFDILAVADNHIRRIGYGSVNVVEGVTRT